MPDNKVPYMPDGLEVTIQGDKFWTKTDRRDVLKAVADTLNTRALENNDAVVLDEISIPSPMSRLVMFEIALFNPVLKKIHEEARNQFFGILTIMALQNIKNMALNIELIDFSQAKPGAEQKFADKIKDFRLTNALFSKDKTGIAETIDRGMYKVTLNKKTIAFLSDSTIICPPFEYLPIVQTDIQTCLPQIYERGKFKSIDKYFRNPNGSINEVDHVAIFALKKYADKIHEIFTQCTNIKDNFYVTGFTSLLQKYCAEINKLYSDVSKSDKMTPNDMQTMLQDIKIRPDSSPAQYSDITDVYSLMDSVGVTYEVKRNSILSLKASKSNPAGKALVVVSSSKICGIDKTSPQASGLVIYDNITYNMLPDTFKSGDIEIGDSRVPDEANGRKYLIYKAEDLLKDTLYLVRRPKAEGKAVKVFNSVMSDRVVGNNPEYEVILPVNSILLEYMSGEELDRAITVKPNGNGDYTATLELNLGCGKHEITRIYKSADANSQVPNGGQYKYLDGAEIPTVAIFPYFKIYGKAPNPKANAWKDYTIFNISKFDSTGELKNKVIGGAFYAEPCYEEKPTKMDVQPLITISDDQRAVSYTHTDVLPSALKLKRMIKDTGAKYDIGIVILSEPERVDGLSDDKWTIAIDFGTTSTTAYHVRQNETGNNARPDFIKIGREFTRDTNCNINDDENNPQSRLVINSPLFTEPYNSYFIDEHYMQRNGYLTAYEKLGNENEATDYGLYNGRAVWHDDTNMDDIRINAKRSENVYTNIKWGKPEDISKSVYYLHQILTHVVYKALSQRISSINWRFSYPTSLTGEHLYSFKANINRILTQLSRSTGDIVTTDVAYCTESCAAAWYYINRYQGSYFACVDIGGGSSDISLWDNRGDLLYQTSVQYASRDIFVEPFSGLFRDQELKNFMCGESSTNSDISRRIKSIEESGSNNMNKDILKTTIELLLIEYIENIRDVGVRRYNNSNYKKFAKSVLVGFSGIMFYLVNSIISIIKKDENIENKTVFIALSGKGASMYDWIRRYLKQESENIEAKSLTDAMATYVEKECGKKVVFRLKFEKENLKTETAKGMLMDARTADMDAELPLITGETINAKMSDGTVQQFDKYYDMKALPFKQIDSISTAAVLDGINDFIEFYNQIVTSSKAGREYLLDIKSMDPSVVERKIRTVQEGVNQKLENFLDTAKVNVDNVFFEPLFISILKGSKEGDGENSGFMKEFVISDS